MFWRTGFYLSPVSGFDLGPALSLSDLFWGASGRGPIWCPEISRRRVDPPCRANRGHRCGPRGCMTHPRRRLRGAIKWPVFNCVREAGGVTWCHYQALGIDPATQLGRPS